jgi:hypothetical protein
MSNSRYTFRVYGLKKRLLQKFCNGEWSFDAVKFTWDNKPVKWTLVGTVHNDFQFVSVDEDGTVLSDSSMNLPNFLVQPMDRHWQIEQMIEETV